MKEGPVSMAEVLAGEGYATGAIVNAPSLSPELGVDRGFQHYDIQYPSSGRIADGTTEDALAWIDGTGGKPFFLFVHYFDPHMPYSPPAPYDTIFDPDYGGDLGRAVTRSDFPNLKEPRSPALMALTGRDWDHIQALYDGEIAFNDKALGDLIRGLEERRLLERTLIVFLSDHGEEFFDHGSFGHGHSLYDELIRVPLVFSLPGAIPRGREVEPVVRLTDIMPTCLSLLGIEASVPMEGADLMPLLTGSGDPQPAPGALVPPGIAYSEALLQGPEQKSLTAPPRKLILDTSDNRIRAYDLDADPGETTDLFQTRPEWFGGLREMLLTLVFATGDTWYVEMQGPGHTFDLEIRPRRETPYALGLYRLTDDAGLTLEAGRAGGKLAFEDLRAGQRMTLAFQAGRTAIPLTFDFTLNGKPATSSTYLGPSLKPPSAMPFRQRANRKSPSAGKPGRRPGPPFFLVWHDIAKGPETEADLSESMKRELKALGYIQ
jgi:hypothetical protein